MRFSILVLLAALASAQGEDVAFVVAGKIATSAGAPVAGVQVQIWDATAPERFLGQVTTGPRGRFFGDVRAAAVARREHRYGPVLLVARGRQLAQMRRVVPAGARDVALTAVKAVPFTVRVEGPDGTPLPAVAVRAVRDGALVQETTTGEDGRCRFDQLAGPDAAALACDIDGIEPAKVERVEGGWRIRFARTPRGAGRVVDAEGAPVADAVLWRAGRAFGPSDAKGRFAVPAGDYVVHAAGHVLRAARVRVDADNDVVLRSSAPLRGVVVDAQDRPLAGCHVRIPEHGLTAWTDERGNYTFPVVPLGRYRLEASRPGFVTARVTIGAAAADDAPTLRLGKGARVAGTITRDGAPALGARVAAGRTVGYADPEGRFLLRGVAPEARRLVATAPGRRSPTVALEGVAEGATLGPFALELRSSLPLRGTITSDAGGPLADVAVTCADRSVKTDADGRFDLGALPIETYEVVARPARHAPLRFTAVPGDLIAKVASSRFGTGEIVVTLEGPRATVTLARRDEPRITRRAEGNHAFVGLPAGVYDVRVAADGYLEAHEEVRLRDKGSRNVLVTLRRGGSLALTASPGASVFVQAVEGRPPPVAALKLASGKTELEGFGPGVYRFIARAPGELIVVKRVRLGPRTAPAALDLRGGEEAALVVTVTDRAGTPLAGASIVLVADGFRWATGQRTGEDGTVELDRLFAGRVEVHAKRGNRVGVEMLTVKPGARHELTVQVR